MSAAQPHATANAADIQNCIRAALANERAAAGHEDKYSNQMRSAGANMFHAFTLALKTAPEYVGRKIDDKAVLRIYKSTAPRKWWDEHLRHAKFLDGKGRPDRDHAARLLQWHVDPEGAQKRRAKHVMQVVASRKKVDKQRTQAARGSTLTHEPMTDEMRELAAELDATPRSEPSVSTQDLLGECNRLQSAAKKVDPSHRGTALEILRVTAREIERYIP